MKKILLGMFFLIFLMLCFSYPAWALQADFLDAANAAYKQGHYDEAIRLYTKVIEYRTTDTRELAGMDAADSLNAYVNRGRCWSKKGNYDLAIADLTEGLSRTYNSQNRREIRYARGKVYYLKRDWDKALEDFTFEEKYGHGNRGWDYVVKLMVGHIWITKGRNYNFAISIISDSIEQKPDNATAFYIRGLAWANKGIYYKAIADFDMAIAINPNLTQAITMRNKVLEQQRKAGTEQ